MRDRQDPPGDPPGVVGCEEYARIGDVPWSACSSQWNPRDELLVSGSKGRGYPQGGPSLPIPCFLPSQGFCWTASIRQPGASESQ